MSRVVVSLGSNIEPEKHIKAALEALARVFPVIACSSLTRTAPIGIKDQADFTNGVVLIETSLDRAAFEIRLKEIEKAAGRKPRAEKWGPREIDLDVLIWDGQVVNKDYAERDFLRQAVDEVCPDRRQS